MCVDNPVPFHSDKPIIAYKVMFIRDNKLESPVAGNEYELGCTYCAKFPKNYCFVFLCKDYGVGFHAFKTIQDAETMLSKFYTNLSLKIVEVELSEITHKGTEKVDIDQKATVYVAKQCKFIRVIE